MVEGQAKTWRQRLSALRNVPPLLKLLWETNPKLCICTLGLRLFLSFGPISNLWISRLILNLVVRAIRGRLLDYTPLWKLVAFDIAIVIASDCISRVVVLTDSILGDQFTNRMSIKIMEHAMTLDLASFEDPKFCDLMERARNQTASRLGMLVSLAGMARQLLTLLTLMIVVVIVSPWLFVLMVVGTIPIFLGETKFVFPEPFSPTSATRSPRRILKLILLNTGLTVAS